MMDYRAAVELVGLDIGAEPAAWEAAGFAVDGDAVRLGDVVVTLRDGRGLQGWSFASAPSGPLDGLPEPRVAAPSAGGATAHPNGITDVDHVVAFSPDLERTIAALEAAGLELRRRREGPTGGGSARQAFFWLGTTILEVVEHPDAAREAGTDAPARLWGLAVVSPDIDATVAFARDATGAAKDAIQEGRRIATFRREAGLGLAVAVMSPHVR